MFLNYESTSSFDSERCLSLCLDSVSLNIFSPLVSINDTNLLFTTTSSQQTEVLIAAAASHTFIYQTTGCSPPTWWTPPAYVGSLTVSEWVSNVILCTAGRKANAWFQTVTLSCIALSNKFQSQGPPAQTQENVDRLPCPAFQQFPHTTQWRWAPSRSVPDTSGAPRLKELGIIRSLLKPTKKVVHSAQCDGICR